MANEDHVTIPELLLVISMIIGFLLMIACVTVVFPKVVRIEEFVATPGKYLDTVRRLWGNGLIGRWMRCAHVFFFIALSPVPFIGRLWRRNAGDEVNPLPLRLKLWVAMPVGGFFVSLLVAILTAYSLEII